jgi:hypothetical protein
MLFAVPPASSVTVQRPPLRSIDLYPCPSITVTPRLTKARRNSSAISVSNPGSIRFSSSTTVTLTPKAW